jgi:hypothetical protein
MAQSSNLRDIYGIGRFIVDDVHSKYAAEPGVHAFVTGIDFMFHLTSPAACEALSVENLRPSGVTFLSGSAVLSGFF